MRVVLDTNIFISGIFWRGSSRKVLDSWKEGRFTLIASLETIYEISKVLSDFKIRLPEEMIRGWVDLIIGNSTVIEIKERMDVVKADPKDNIFIETAMSGNADLIISRDKHLLRIGEINGVRIITPEEFNETLGSD